MKEQSLPSDDSSPLSQLIRVDQACRRFEAAWKAGERPSIPVFLSEAATSDRAALLRELIHLEIHYCRIAHEDPRPQEYLGQFPSLDAAWLEDVLASRRAPSRSRPVPADEAAFAAASTIDYQRAAVSSVDGERKDTGNKTALPGGLVHVPGYEVLGVLGRGGMGVVYKARHLALNRVVALKMIRDGALAGPEELDRFRREAKAIARLQHPHIVQIHEVGAHDGRPFFSLEFVEGGSLDRRLKGTPAPPKQAAQIVEMLARAVQAAHEAGVIHRDLKPANVLVGAKWTLKITDFGLAKNLDVPGQTQTGAVMGTPSYMAAEQAAGKVKEIGPATDVYALGAILYECLTGRPPFKAATMMDTLFQVVHDEPVAPRQLQPKTPRDLETICLKCLQKDPRKRYASAEALAEDLRHFLAGEPITARPVGPVERGVKWVRRWPVVSALTTLFVASLVAGTVVSWRLAALANDRADQVGNDLITIKGLQNQTQTTLLKSQERLADQLILSLGRDSNTVGPLEWKALWTVAGLPKDEERTRILFIDRALDAPETAELLGRRSAMAAHAAVGLDRTRRGEILKLLMTRLGDRERDGRIRTACALAVTELTPADPKDADMAAQVILDAIFMAKAPDPNALGIPPQALGAVAARLDDAGAVAFAQRILDAMVKNPNTALFAYLAQALGPVASRLDEAGAAAFAPRILDAMVKNPNTIPSPYLAQALGAVASRLDEAGAAAFAPRILDAMDNNPSPFTRAPLARALGALASRLDGPGAAAAAPRILDFMTRTGLLGAEMPLAQTFGVLAPRLDEATARAAAPRTLDAMANTRDPFVHDKLAQALAALASHLDEATATTAAQRLLDGMADTNYLYNHQNLALALSAVGPRMDKPAATAAAQRILDAMAKTSVADSALCPVFALALGGVLRRMDEAEAHKAAATAAQRILDPKNALGVAAFAQALGAIIPRMDEATAAAAAPRILEAMSRTSDPKARANLAQALDAIDARMDKATAAAAAPRILEAMSRTSDPKARANLAQALDAIDARMDEAEVHKAAATAAQRILDDMAKSTDPSAAHALSEAAARMDEEEAHKAAAAAAQRLLDAMAKTPSPGNLEGFARALAEVAARMDEAEARKATATAAQRILDVMANLPDAHALSPLAGGLGAILPRMDATEAHKAAATAAQRILDVMANLPDANALEVLAGGRFGGGLGAVLPGMDAAEAHKAAATAAQRFLDVKTTDPNALAAFLRGLGAVLPGMDAAEAHKAAAAAAQRILGAVDKTPDSGVPSYVVEMLGIVAPWLDGAGAAAIAQRILDAMDRIPNPSLFEYPAKSIAVVIPRLDEAGAAAAASRLLDLLARNPSNPMTDDSSAAFRALVARLSLQGEVDLLKHPACVGQARDVVLLEIGKQLDHRFADMWDLVDWLADHHPEIDVLSPPQPPQP